MALTVAALFASVPLDAATMQTEVTLTLGSTGMQSFASYRYYWDSSDKTPQKYYQYHTIVNGNVEEETNVFTDVWSNNLRSYVLPRHPNCYNARITLSVSSGAVDWCCLTEVAYYDDAGVQCPAEEEEPDPNQSCNLTCWTTCNNGVCPPMQEYQECTPYCSPLVLDVRDDGIQTTGADDPVLFDIDADGSLESMGWLARGGDDTFLWRDVEKNNRIDDGGELFGVGMTLPNGRRAADGFEALAAYDEIGNGGNGDGAITDADAVWRRLRLWNDSNHNGISENTEIAPIQASCVASLDLRWTPSAVVDASGNQFRMVSTYKCRTSRPGGYDQRDLIDVFFRVFR